MFRCCFVGDVAASGLAGCDRSLSFVCEYMQNPIIASVTPIVIFSVKAFFSPGTV